MRSRHVYASVALFKEYLAGENITKWTEDQNIIRTVLESASLTIEQHVGDRSFGPFAATREYDLGRGALRRQSEIPGRALLIDGLASPSSRGIIPLGDWLAAVPTTVTAYDGSARGSNTELTFGLVNDYILEPDHQAPYDTLKLSENTSAGLSAGQKTLTIEGAWGWQSETEVLTGAIAEALDATEVDIDISRVGEVSPGVTLLIEDEQMYVRREAGTVITVVRGANGTTAATHDDATAISIYRYPADVVEACMSIARDRYRSREAGTTALLGLPGAPFPRPGAETRAILKSLNYYLQRRESSGVYF